MQINTHYGADTDQFLRGVVSDPGGPATGTVGPSTRGGRPVNFNSEVVGKVQIDPESPYHQELDLSALRSSHVSYALDEATRKGETGHTPADLAHAIVTNLRRQPQAPEDPADDRQRPAHPARQPEQAFGSQSVGTPLTSFFGSPPAMEDFPPASDRQPDRQPDRAAPVAAAPAAAISVTFERSNGDSVEAVYHDVVRRGPHLTLAYDHSAPAQMIFRPGMSEDPLSVTVARDGYAAKTFLCYPTGYRLRHRNWEYLAFVVQAEQEF